MTGSCLRKDFFSRCLSENFSVWLKNIDMVMAGRNTDVYPVSYHPQNCLDVRAGKLL